MDTLAHMQLFLRVVQGGSLSAAGRQIGVSPASVFRGINALEDSLGVRLLNRTSRKLTLTEAGQLYLARIEPILSEIEGLNAEIGQLQVTPRGTLRVHARMSFGNRQLAPRLPDFLSQYPGLCVDLRLSDRPLDLVDENIDVALRVGEVNSPSLMIRKLVSSRRVVCASPAYLARNPIPERPEDLTEHNCLTFYSEFNQPIWRFMKDGELTECRVRGSLQSDGGDVLRLGALKGLGIALLPTWNIGPDLEDGTLVALLPGYQATPFGFDDSIYIVTQKVRHRSLKVQLFIDFCLKSFRDRQDWKVPA
ncbi:MAG: hypothetical protein B7X76_00980 [Azorhizobium sp. 39-67-5]|nr:MAG: hypothetical protein B7X76_00980 [Azorhizobium sp. 39-67-5]